MDFSDIQKLVKAKEDEFQELWDRMDEDKDLYTLEPYVMPDSRNPSLSAPGVDNITLNDPAIFANKVISTLASTSQQRVIIGSELKSDQEDVIEECLFDVRAFVDDLQIKRNDIELFRFAIQQLCLRGPAARRIALYKEGEIKFDGIVGLDTRYLTFESDTDGLVWTNYKTFRSSGQIEREYGESITGTQIEVNDYWDRDQNIVYLKGGNVLKSNANPYKDRDSKPYVPVALAIPPTGANFKDDDNLEHWAESIFEFNRNLYDELNKCASIDATLNRLSMRPPYQYLNEAGKTAQPPDYPIESTVTAMGVAEGLKIVDIPDIRKANMQLWQILSGSISKGSLPGTDYGNLTFPLPAVGIMQLMEQGDRVYAPRIQAWAILEQQTDQMIISQLLQLGGSFRLGAGAKREKYQSSMLKGQYSIGYEFFRKNPMKEAANYTMAATAKPFLPLRLIHENILETEDPEGTMAELEAEQAEMLSPAIKMFRLAKSLVRQADKDGDDGKRVEAKVLALKAKALMQMEIQGTQITMPGLPQANANPMLPLFSKGGGGKQMGEEAPTE